MARVSIDSQRCKGCLLCVAVCPKGRIKPQTTLNTKGARPVAFEGAEECPGCCFCAIICPDCCIEVEK